MAALPYTPTERARECKQLSQISCKNKFRLIFSVNCLGCLLYASYLFSFDCGLSVLTSEIVYPD